MQSQMMSHSGTNSLELARLYSGVGDMSKAQWSAPRRGMVSGVALPCRV